MKERILHFLKATNKSSSQFAAEIGVQPSSVSHIISGRNKPSLDFIIKMLEYYKDLDTEWLLFGSGNMFKSYPEHVLFENENIQGSDKTEPVSSMNPELNGVGINMQEGIKVSDHNENNEAKSAEGKFMTNEPDHVVIFYRDGTFRIFNQR